MKFDGPGIIGFPMGGLNTDSFARLTMIRNTGAGYDVFFVKPNGQNDCWCISATSDNSFIEIDGIRYKGDALTSFCETFITMTETEEAIDSL